MNPNQQLSRDQQIQFLSAQLEATKAKVDAVTNGMASMRVAIAKLNDVGPVPALSDVVKIATGIRLLVEAQLTILAPDYEQLLKQLVALQKGVEALKAQGSGLIHGARLIPPSMGKGLG